MEGVKHPFTVKTPINPATYPGSIGHTFPQRLLTQQKSITAPACPTEELSLYTERGSLSAATNIGPRTLGRSGLSVRPESPTGASTPERPRVPLVPALAGLRPRIRSSHRAISCCLSTRSEERRVGEECR